MPKIKFMHIRLLIYIISIILIAFVVNGKIKTSCFFLDNYGIMCPACGLTRATIDIIKFDIKSAFSYNAFYTCILVPLVLFLIINDVYIYIKGTIKHKKEISFIEIILGEK